MNAHFSCIRGMNECIYEQDGTSDATVRCSLKIPCEKDTANRMDRGCSGHVISLIRSGSGSQWL